MKQYTFESLSSLEFENLSRDLLQEELSLTLESFKGGKDSGIDARWEAPVADEHDPTSALIIVQCKHYARSSFAELERVIKGERKKLDALRPTRYILTTSQGLTPSNKTSLLKVLGPYCLAPGDILGRDDLNNLLGKFEGVERRHYKLWLTSTQVLGQLLTFATQAESQLAVTTIRERMKRYVQNDSFPRALEQLDQHRFTLIVGDPGVGKTTLAEALLVYHVDLGFQPIVVRSDLSELRGLANPDRKQVFYYDDFLGKTGFSVEKNEDSHLVSFLKLVARTPTWRFMLTTRDYILSNARRMSEVLGQFPFDVSTCTVKQEDYTRPIRARILYNHLYFSDLRPDLKLQVLLEHHYLQIVDHKNYNPRVIEHMTDAMRIRDLSPDTYLADFVAALDNPLQVWAHAYRAHLSREARDLLLSLLTLRDGIDLATLSRAFWSLHRHRQLRYSMATSPWDFDAALKELDGNFVRTTRGQQGLEASFRNPSVQDFLELHLDESGEDLHDIILSSVSLAQLQKIWRGRRGRPYRGLRDHVQSFTQKCLEYLTQELDEEARDLGMQRTRRWRSGLQRFSLAWGLVQFAPCSQSRALLELALTDLKQAMEDRDIDEEDTIEAVKVSLLGLAGLQSEWASLLSVVKERILGDLEYIDDFYFVKRLSEAVEAALDDADLSRARIRFEECVASREWARGFSSSGEYYEGADFVEDLGRFFNVDVAEEIERLHDRARDKEFEEESETPTRILTPEDAHEPGMADLAIVQEEFASYARELQDLVFTAPPEVNTVVTTPSVAGDVT